MVQMDARRPDACDRFGLWAALAFFLATRALIVIVGLTAPLHRDGRDPKFWWDGLPLTRWDSGHYSCIMIEGYPPEITDRVAFFPGYPIFARPFAALTDRYWGLVLASHVAGALGVAIFYVWARRHVGPRSALIAVMLLSCYPPAMFLSVGYAEGVFLLCVAAVLWLLDRGRLLAAALAAAVASATRPTGLVISALVTLWTLLALPLRPWPRRLAKTAVIGVVSVSGLIAYQLFLWHKYGRPDAFFAAQANWAAPEARNPWERALTLRPVLAASTRPLKCLAAGQFDKLLEGHTWNDLLNLSILVIALVGLWRPRGLPRLAFLIPLLQFALAYAQDPVTGARLVGIARYQLVALPCFALLAVWLSGLRARPLLVVLLAGQLFLQCFYMRGYADWEMVG